MEIQNKDSSAHYKHLVIMTLIHVPIMYIIMFVMVDRSSSIYNNLNTFFMAVMMATPMAALMTFMGGMYHDKKKNLIVYIFSFAALIVFYVFVRAQVLIGDKQFLRSMIPHHSGAILMCEKSKLQDDEIKKLCTTIVDSQKSEVEQMKKILERL